MTDWDPNDPESVNVHYDVSAWSVDQRAELSEALAEADIAHVWETEGGADELVVPEELEGVTDELFARLEEALGPFPIPLGAEHNPVEYGLDEWPAADRATLTTAIVEAEIPHRWDDATLYVPAAAETAVDDLLDALEAGTLAVHSADEDAPPEGALSDLFDGADRLAKDADDRVGRELISALAAILVPGHAPYGVGGAAWSSIVAATNHLAELGDDEDSSSSDVIGAAQHLRSLVRPYV
jgi:hypothetical protein